MSSYDTIIIGAGPAGATLGYELGRRGISTLIIEGEKLPREKTCAGGITPRCFRLLDFDISSVVERTTYGVKFTYRFKEGCIKRHSTPFIYTVMRSKFDHLLVRRAQEAGVSVIDGLMADDIRIDGSTIKVITSAETYTAKIVAGADGARGMVAKRSGLMRGAALDLAIEARVPYDEADVEGWDSLVGIDVGYIPGGYAWVFPKKDHLSVGVGGAASLSKRFKAYFDQLLCHLGVEEEVGFRGHLMPMRGKGVAIQRDNVLLLGDAAGLVHPFTREGIFYAVRSARLAAPVIEGALGSDAVDLGGYERAVDDKLMPSIEMGRTLRRIFTHSPHLCYKLVKRSDRLWGYVSLAFMGARPKSA